MDSLSTVLAVLVPLIVIVGLPAIRLGRAQSFVAAVGGSVFAPGEYRAAPFFYFMLSFALIPLYLILFESTGALMSRCVGSVVWSVFNLLILKALLGLRLHISRDEIVYTNGDGETKRVPCAEIASVDFGGLHLNVNLSNGDTLEVSVFLEKLRTIWASLQCLAMQNIGRAMKGSGRDKNA